MLYVKADTAVTVPIGPFVDATDGFTAETTVALGSADSAKLLKNGAATPVDIASNTLTAVSGMDGMYNLALTAAQLDTEGSLVILIEDEDLCRPVRQELTVVNANVYDSLFGQAGTDYLQVDAMQLNSVATSGLLSGSTMLNADAVAVSGSASAADALEAGALGVVTGAVNGTTSTVTSIVTNLTETTNDHYNGRTVVFTGGTLAGQAQTVLDYNGASATITVAGLTEAPANTDTFVIV